MSKWPEMPGPGEHIRLPVPLPPTLLGSLGYSGGDRRLVALIWPAGAAEPLLTDGSSAQPADQRGWIQFAHHAVGRAILRPYQLRPAETEAGHALVADLWASTLSVGRRQDVIRLVASQPNTIDAAIELLGHHRVAEIIQDTVTELFLSPDRPSATVPDPSRAARHALRLWLDERQAIIMGAQPPPPGPNGIDLGL